MTEPIKVDDANFLLDRMAADCSPNQDKRELTQNAQEAIQATLGQTGKIIWDLDWDLLEFEGLHKIQIIDTGIGMNLDQLRRYMNRLSCSGNVQAMDRNYGLGAKISAGAKNPCGVVYRSLVKNAENGHEITFHRDEQGVYGLQPYQFADGSVDYSDTKEPEDFHEEIQKAGHGTQITLLGKEWEENTFRMGGSQWFLQKYLNLRYFKFPPGVEIRVRQLPGDPKKWPKSRKELAKMSSQKNIDIRLRQVFGQKYYLDNYSENSGRVDIGKAIVHWWILKDEPSVSMALTRGHICALYQDEIYEMSTKRSDLGRFGIYNTKAARRVVIYVQPKILPNQQVIPTSSRNGLRLAPDGELLPWEEWQIEFQKQMPTALEEFNASFDKDIDNESDDVRKEMEKNSHLYELQAYRRARKRKESRGELRDDSEDDVNGPAPSRRNTNGGSGSSSRGGPKRDRFRRGKGKKLGDQNVDNPRIDFPFVTWVTIREGSRSAGDEVEDRAAIYIPTTHRLEINEDFRVIAAMIKRSEERWNETNNPEIAKIIKHEVRRAYELILTEAVVGVRGLQGSPEWTPEDLYEKALSPEALTATIQLRVGLWGRINRNIGSHTSRMRKEILASETEDVEEAQA